MSGPYGQAKLGPTSGPLHGLFPLPDALFLCVYAWLLFLQGSAQRSHPKRCLPASPVKTPTTSHVSIHLLVQTFSNHKKE